MILLKLLQENNYKLKIMADFDQMGDLDLPQAQEATEEAQEKFQERVAAAQKALKQLKKDEGKKKKQDNHLAKIIAYFLQTSGNTDLAGLIAQLAENDTPSDFILALLALVDTQSRDAIAIKKEQLLLEGAQSVQVKVLNLEEKELVDLSTVMKQALDVWFEDIYIVAQSETEKIMEKTLDHDLNIDLNVIQLAAFLMQRYLQKQGNKMEYNEIYQFVTVALKTVYERLQVEYAEKLQLK